MAKLVANELKVFPSKLFHHCLYWYTYCRHIKVKPRTDIPTGLQHSKVKESMYSNSNTSLVVESFYVLVWVAV